MMVDSVAPVWWGRVNGAVKNESQQLCEEDIIGMNDLLEVQHWGQCAYAEILNIRDKGLKNDESYYLTEVLPSKWRQFGQDFGELVTGANYVGARALLSQFTEDLDEYDLEGARAIVEKTLKALEGGAVIV